MSAVAQNFETGEKLSHMATSLYNDATSHRTSEPEKFESPEDKAFLLVHDALYHQCQITIYSMIVPVFSGMPTDPAIDLDKQKKGAEIVTKHADLFRRLLHPFLCGQRHVSLLPPLVGYGAFVVAIVLLTLEISCKSRNGSRIPSESSKTGCRLNSVISILNLLDELRIYWRALQTPVRDSLAHSTGRSDCPNYMKWETLNAALQAHFSEHLGQSSLAHSRIGMSPIWPLSVGKHGIVTNVRSGKPSTNPTSENVPEMPTHNQKMSTSDYQLGNSSGATRSADILQGQGDSLLSSGIDDGIGGSSEFEMNDTLMSQADLLPDYDWYSLSFAEAGVQEFSGLEPSTLFQQGWHTFS